MALQAIRSDSLSREFNGFAFPFLLVPQFIVQLLHALPDLPLATIDKFRHYDFGSVDLGRPESITTLVFIALPGL